MKYQIDQAIEILSRTPATLSSMLLGLSEPWVIHNEGGESWSPYDIVGHLIHGERSDWMQRIERILELGEAWSFEPFDRFAQFHESRGKSLRELLETFADLRQYNLKSLDAIDITEDKLELCGTHPDFGQVTLRQLLATWVVHDLGHLAQAARVMAKQYAGEVGPWKAYSPILKD